jgi:hypothetical protein
MNKLQTSPPNLGEHLHSRAMRVKQDCQMVIINDPDYKKADDLISDTATMAKAIKDYWKPRKDAARKSWELNCDSEKEMLKPVLDGIEFLKEEMKGYRAERERLEKERQEAEHQKQLEELTQATFEMAEEGVPQDVIDKIHEDHIPFSAKQTQELRSRTKFKGDYEVTIATVEDEEGNEIEQWDKVDKTLLLPQTKAHKEAILHIAREEARKNYGKKMTGFNIEAIENAKIRRTR